MRQQKHMRVLMITKINSGLMQCVLYWNDKCMQKIMFYNLAYYRMHIVINLKTLPFLQVQVHWFQLLLQVLIV